MKRTYLSRRQPQAGPLLAGKTIAERAVAKAAHAPDTVALHIDGGPDVTIGAIVAEAEAVAAGLRRLGINQSETISFQLPNWREAVAINLAAAMLGLRINPITPIYRGAELRFILEDSGSVLLFIPDGTGVFDYGAMLDRLRPDLPLLRHVLHVRGMAGENSYEHLRETGARHLPLKPCRVDMKSPKLLLYTSGTTGRAKGVIHSHESLECGSAAIEDNWELGANDAVLTASPVTHITGFSFGLELPFFSDARTVLMPRWDAARAVALIRHYHVTASIGATTFLKELIDEAERTSNHLPSLRLFACGGAAVPAQLIIRAARLAPQCQAFRVYGATEIPLVTKGFLKPSERSLAAETDGPVKGYSVRITDPDGAIVPAGHIGEIRAKSPSMFIGYTDPAETARAIDADGFFKSGDLGLLTEQDAIIVTGRLKDIIIRGGENLSPGEIEEALEQHPAILEAAVVAMPHPRLGEGVAAFIRTRDGHEIPSLTELADYLESIGLARQKFPERLEYIDDFPRTASGKIRKEHLRNAVKRPLILLLDP